MSIKEFLESLSGRTIVPEPALPRESHMFKAMKQVEQRLEAVYAKAGGLDIEEFHRRLREAVASDKWDKIANREWRYVPLCLCLGTSRLLEDPKFMNFYLSRLNKEANRLALRRLIGIYLYAFDPNVPGIRAIADFLAKRTDLGDEWAHRHREVALFSPDNAPERLAKRAMAAISPVDFLSDMGFERSLESAQLAGYAFLKSLQFLELTLRTSPSVEQIRKVTSWGMKEEKQLRYALLPGMRGKLAEALLLPWSTADPPSDVREFTERFLLDYYRDPRIIDYLWKDVGEDARRVMMRWLTKASLDWFLTVVDVTTTDPEIKHMWPARRKFWNAYYRHKYMEEAWVVFGPVGTAYATQVAERDRRNHGAGMSFGRLQKGGVSAEHAVLLMRIGDLTVADWNFNGKCHIWLGKSDGLPKLYHREYDRSDLTRGSNFQQVHYRGSWQKPVYDFIRNNTGASMHHSEYM